MKPLPDGPSMNESDLLSIFTTNPFPFLKECHEKYGDMFTLELGDFGIDEYQASGKWVFLANADYLKILFKSSNTVQLAGRANQILFQKILPDEGSLMLDGQAHLERRKILGKVLQGEKKTREFTPSILQITQDEISGFPANQAFPLTASFRRIAAQMMRKLTFGALCTDETGQVTDNVCQFGDPGMLPEQRQGLINQSTAALGKMLSACPHARQASADSTLFSVLTDAWQVDNTLRKIDVQAELMVVMLAGVDTSANTMAWVTAQILSRPAVFAKVRQELHQVLGPVQTASAEQFDQMPYLDAVIHETTRLCPLLFTTTPRLLIQPLQMGDFLLPPGTMAASCMNVIHTRPDYYPDPLTFRPERFIETKPDPYRYIYFGGGIRRCPGMGFALYEMKVIIATILHSCTFELVDVSTVAERQGSFFAPKGSISVKLTSPFNRHP